MNLVRSCDPKASSTRGSGNTHVDNVDVLESRERKVFEDLAAKPSSATAYGEYDARAIGDDKHT